MKRRRKQPTEEIVMRKRMFKQHNMNSNEQFARSCIGFLFVCYFMNGQIEFSYAAIKSKWKEIEKWKSQNNLGNLRDVADDNNALYLKTIDSLFGASHFYI